MGSDKSILDSPLTNFLMITICFLHVFISHTTPPSLKGMGISHRESYVMTIADTFLYSFVQYPFIHRFPR